MVVIMDQTLNSHCVFVGYCNRLGTTKQGESLDQTVKGVNPEMDLTVL